MRGFRRGEEARAEGTDRDIPLIAFLLGMVMRALGMAAFLGSLAASLRVLLAGLGLTLLFSFFFASIAAMPSPPWRACWSPAWPAHRRYFLGGAAAVGLSGSTGMFFVMAIAAMVCTALSVSGQAITDFKTGYWLGSTPAAQEKVKFLGVIAASIAVGLTIVLLARAFQFGDAVPGDTRAVLPSPQASIMKALGKDS